MGKLNAFIVSIVRFAIKFLFFLLPIKKSKILFINFNGRGYGCNPKYIAEEILNQKLPLDLVWCVSDTNEPLPSGIRKVKFRPDIKYFYEIATAKVIVTNVKNDLGLFKKRGQYIIQTWHGSMGGKRAEGDALDTLSPQYIK
ncbi:MAG: CDP-glycerol glycerophosphotransferase family protein, partial [Acutalibacteraceae bacterium]|nr:CDP-glycerol glycerophosphotransferase family protein [Acutalibacteraceae bacterium]